ncbi:hypothetical protein A4X13_0g3088 [Tilletia indica]|uniref:ABC transporter domain-containing protein n=1 Tax=Tilletia indica TaxID=43049 RepID=A0A177TPE3_9BASI|nr:hypothetical protein A4X13_0g3088 [Tilletia indica]
MSSSGAIRGGRGRGGGAGWGDGGGGRGGRGGGSGGGGGGGGGGRGRGAYYKALYGGGGGGGNPKRARTEADDSPTFSSGSRTPTGTWKERPSTDLRDFLASREGASYPAYKDLLGQSWNFPSFSSSSPSTSPTWKLRADSVQSDPYAPPSKFRIWVPHSVSSIPREMWERRSPSKFRMIALADFFLRALVQSFSKASSHWEAYIRSGGGGGGGGGGGWGSNWSSGKGGQLEIDAPGQQVLDRSALRFDAEGIEARFRIGLPARGRSVLGKQAYHLLATIIPTAVQDALQYALEKEKMLWDYVAALEDSYALTSHLNNQNLVAFVANGSILPRASGASDQPMSTEGAVEFVSPSSLETEVRLPHGGVVKGMGLRKGSLTVLIGGGFHGKSTLLEALSYGSYVHVPGDGRELVRTSDSTVLIQSEDGRCVNNVDISPFIKNLPSGKSTSAFSTTNASGSTSCSASLVEAVELGSELILIDEDTTAANWLQREQAMSQLVPNEPISPFVDHVRELLVADGRVEGRSVVIVCGSSTYFLQHADHVLLLDGYRIKDVTQEAHKLFPRSKEVSAQPFPITSRSIDLSSFPRSDGRNKGTFEVPRSTRVLRIRDDRRTPPEEEPAQTQTQPQDEDLSLQLSRCVPQLVHPSQARAIAAILNQLPLRAAEWTTSGSSSGSVSLKVLVDRVDAILEGDGGVENLQFPRGGAVEGDLARPRKVDLGAVINRLRVVQMK